MNNILFIGGAGFIGSSLIRQLLEKRKDVSVFVVEPAFANASRLNGLEITLYRTDLGNFDFLESIIRKNRIDTIVHLVSTLIPGSGYEDYKKEIQTVAFPTFRLTQLCSELGVRFVYFSSGGTVYGNRKRPIPFIESDEREPISYYGLTKLMIENNILFEHRTRNLRYLIVRPSNPYGHGQALNGKQGIIAVAIGKILSGESIEIWGDGSSVRDYIYIDDLAEAFCMLLEIGVENTIVNIGSGEGYSVNDILKLLKRITNKSIKIDYKSARNADVSAMILSIDKLRSLIDLRLTPLAEGMKIFYEEEIKKLG